MYDTTNRPRPRVFVSSVMKGYEVYREATRVGIRQAECDAVLAEDFAAQSASSRNACIDGVQSADALVLLLGPRYGWVAPSGRSATEEEYQEARRQQMPILAFVQDGQSTEPDQQAFVARVEDYIHGHFRKSFRNSDDLERLVKEAVMARDWGAVPQDLDGAEGRIREALSHRPTDNRYSVWMKTVWATLRNEEVVDPLILTDKGSPEPGSPVGTRLRTATVQIRTIETDGGKRGEVFDRSRSAARRDGRRRRYRSRHPR